MTSLTLRWRTLLAAIALVVLFIPIRRYTLPANLPFELEPYRLLVIVVIVGWLLSLLADPRVRLRASGFEGPIVLFGAAIVGSLMTNPGRTEEFGAGIVKGIMFFATFLLVFYLVVSVIRRQVDVDALCKVLVGGGSVVALLAIIESRTGYNVFDHLSSFIPFLRVNHAPTDTFLRGTELRAYASAQHPIALGAALVILLPVAVYLARRTGERRWWLGTALLLAGLLTTVSRTAVIMLLVVIVVLLGLRPKETWRLVPALALVLVAVHLAVPGTLQSFRDAFFPTGGLQAEQGGQPGARSSGRLADVRPTLQKAAAHPLLGQGFGTEVVDGTDANALILDDQWLGTLLETGVLGVLAVVWLFGRFVWRAARAARSDPSPRGSLLAALAASVTAYAVGMVTYDAFSFVQVTFLLFILLALGAVLLATAPGPIALPGWTRSP